MAIVEKGNKVLRISDEKIEEYLKMGYCQIDENGKVKRKSTAMTLDGLKQEIEALVLENKKLKTENTKLKKELKKVEEME